MGATPNYSWPYPTPSTPTDGPGAFQAALDAADTTVKTVADTVPALLDSVAGDITSSAPGDTVAAGTASKSSRADHKHAREAFGAVGDVTTSAVADSTAAGTSTKVARADHKHGREAFGAVGDISSSAVGDTAGAGTSNKIARADHKHAREAASGAWTTWSPVITAATTNPTYTDNGSAYRLDGKTLFVRLSITYITRGTGQYTLAMPGGLTAQLTYGDAHLMGGSLNVSLASIATGNHIQFLDNTNSGYGSATMNGTPTLALSGVIEVN